MDLYRINLNLLVALDVLLDEQSVTLSAKKMFLTQSAMSNNLLQLRDIFKNELLVREKNRMVLTGFAKELQPRLKQVLLDLDGVLKPTVFEPKQSTRIFKIGMNAYAAAVILPLLMSVLKDEAPNLQINISAILPSQLVGDESFEHDFGLRVFFEAPLQQKKLPATDFDAPLAPFLEKKLLFTDTTVCIVGQHHPLAKMKEITQKNYISYKHVAMSPPNSRSRSHYRLDNILKGYNVRREVQLIVPYKLAYFNVIKTSDSLIGTILKNLFLTFDTPGVSMKNFPFEYPEIEVCMVWHKRYENDAAHQWLRNIIIEIGKKVQKHVDTNTPFYSTSCKPKNL